MYRFDLRNLTGVRKVFLPAVLLIILSLLMASCGSKSMNTSDASAPMAPVASAAAQEEAGSEKPKSGFGSTAQNNGSDVGTPADSQENRKLIMNGNASLETLEFDASIESMDRLIQDYKGFAETRTVLGKSNNSRALRSATYVIRIPAESFDTVLKSMGNIGNVLESTSEGTDITDQYYDSETRIRTLKVQEQTLMDILSKASKLEDVITLETRLSEIRYDIESIENTLNNYDRLVAYSRIRIYIQEVDDVTQTKPVEKKLNERVFGAFNQSIKRFRIGLENFLVWLAESWISLLFLAAIAVIVRLVLKKKYRKSNFTQKPPVEETQKDDPKK